MARMSLLIGRLTDLIEYSDASYGRPTIWLLMGIVGALFLLSRKGQEHPPDSHEPVAASGVRLIQYPPP
jgi:hypothetical protein